MPQTGSFTQRLKVAKLRVVEEYPELKPEFWDSPQAAKEKAQQIDRLASSGEFTKVPGATAIAYVNHDRWVADCPVCNGAELVERGHDMLCGSCGAVHDVDWPNDTDRKQAEALLAKRPAPLRNWNRHKGETADTLVAENIEQGVA